MNTLQIKRGDIYYVVLDSVVGSEQDGIRPSIIVQNDVGNLHSPTTQIIPMTTQMKKHHLPTHVIISQSCGMDESSMALAEQLRTVDKSRLGAFVGRINQAEQFAIDKAVAISVGLLPPTTPVATAAMEVAA